MLSYLFLKITYWHPRAYLWLSFEITSNIFRAIASMKGYAFLLWYVQHVNHWKNNDEHLTSWVWAGSDIVQSWSKSISNIFHFGHLPFWPSFSLVVFHLVIFQFGHLPFWLSSTLVVFHFGGLPFLSFFNLVVLHFWSSSIWVVFQLSHLLFWSS